MSSYGITLSSVEEELLLAQVASVHTCTLSWWRHQMATFPRYWPFVRGIHRWPVDSPHKGQWHEALIVPLICPWTNGCVRITHCEVHIGSKRHQTCVVQGLEYLGRNRSVSIMVADDLDLAPCVTRIPVAMLDKQVPVVNVFSTTCAISMWRNDKTENMLLLFWNKIQLDKD